MKIVKLDKRHKFYHAGFTVAFRFDSYTEFHALNIYSTLISIYGISTYCDWGTARNDRFAAWGDHWGKAQRDQCKPYWIGLRNEEDVTMILLTTTAR